MLGAPPLLPAIDRSAKLVRQIDAHCPRLIDDVARKGRHLQVDLRLRVQQCLLVEKVVAERRGGPIIPERAEAEVDQPIRWEVHQVLVDVQERDGLAIGRIRPRTDVIPVEG